MSIAYYSFFFKNKIGKFEKKNILYIECTLYSLNYKIKHQKSIELTSLDFCYENFNSLGAYMENIKCAG